MRLQRAVSNDIIINNYHYIVGCVNTILIFPYLVSSRVVQQDFRQYLDGERTDKDKMMALLRELTRCPLETKSSLVLCPIFLSTRPLSNISWKVPFCNANAIYVLPALLWSMTECVHTHKSTSILHLDFTELMEDRQAHTFPEDSRERRPQAVVCTAMSNSVGHQCCWSGWSDEEGAGGC